MIKSKHMYFIIATMALGYVGDAAAVTAPRLADTPVPEGKVARRYNVDDSYGCILCLQYDRTGYEGTDSDFRDYLETELTDQGGTDFACSMSLDKIEVYAWGTSSLPNDNGVYYECTASGWTQRNPSLPDGDFDYNNGTIYGGVDCRYSADGSYYSCDSCSSVSCNDGYYGNPTGCEVMLNECLPCPVSTYKKAIGGSGSFYTCTTQLQPGQSVAGQNSTISDCQIPKLVGGSGGAYCNDNGFFIWNSECSYAG